jgi:radical SAM protein with 4Fe4S-binding SPASM domain
MKSKKSKSYIARYTRNQSRLWKRTKPILSWLDIEITERCNNNCIHCYINLPANESNPLKKELSTLEIKEILRESVSLGCLNVRFTGGEPLLRDDFQELYLFARGLGLGVILFTNATLITERLVELFRKTPLLNPIEVSVYGMKKSSYEAVTRSAGSFESAWRGINLLLKKKIPFVVKSAIFPANKTEIREFETWAANIPGMTKPPSYSMSFDLRCRRDDKEKNRLIKSVRVTAQEALKVITRDKDRYLKMMKEFCSKFIRPSGDKLFSCGSGIGRGCVDAYGYFQPCLLLRHPDTVYNLKKGSLKDALTNFFPKVREIKATNSEYLARCAKCFLKGFCEQCPAKSWMEHGILDTPVEYLCDNAHAEARFLGLLQEDEMAWEVKNWKKRIKKFTSS